ncbi:DUF3159 domain-containing protein [Pseudonocardia endophytica]|uniref:Uncharacterized protein DUF3159 n=1 Tax=Pseudonocardia endophytica TaxID=401976 RepID=A0A4R1HK03_PSEEN|nr:DUF3159 domain-containing protein [Pseudonocardia endophytica]TCK20835.1 uncharacterized protein DUF3159 [Pseudonocardia endophytica]
MTGPDRERGRRRLPAPPGGWSGAATSAVGPTVFAPAAQLFGLLGGVACGLLAVAATAAVLAARGRSLRPVVGGLVGLGVSGTLVWWTGSTTDAFLVDVWYPLVASVVLFVSVVVGRPLVGVVWDAARDRTGRWRTDRPVRCVFTLATVALATVGGARFAVQHELYENGLVLWLTVAKVAMGLPLTVVALCTVGWAVARAERRWR